jgi:predicted ATPase
MGLKRLDEAHCLLIKAIDLIEETGERRGAAEAHRLLGEWWCQQPACDQQAAERAFLEALELARSQQARGFELRAATSLARLWQSQGKRKEALDLLKPIFDWFTEGFDTKDLREAKALLDDLNA